LEQLLLLRRGQHGTVVAPAAVPLLSRDQPQRQLLDAVVVRTVPQSVEEQQGQRELVGLIQLWTGIAEKLGRFFDGRIIHGHAALDQRQGGEGSVAGSMVSLPASIGGLHLLQELHATEQGFIHLLLLLRRKRHQRGRDELARLRRSTRI